MLHFLTWGVRKVSNSWSDFTVTQDHRCCPIWFPVSVPCRHLVLFH